MAKILLLFLAILTNACTTGRQHGELSASKPATIVWGPFAEDERLRTMIEDRRSWIDSTSPF